MTKKQRESEPGKRNAKQDQTSAESMRNPSQTNKQRAQEPSGGQSSGHAGSAPDGPGSENGSEAGERRSAGTPDLPRERRNGEGGDIERGSGGHDESLVNESTGAFKERP